MWDVIPDKHKSNAVTRILKSFSRGKKTMWKTLPKKLYVPKTLKSREKELNVAVEETLRS